MCRYTDELYTDSTGPVHTPARCRWPNGTLTLDVLALSKDVLGFTNVWYESARCHSSTVNLSRRESNPRHRRIILPGDEDGSLQGTGPHGLSSQPPP
jgi:hypothetical protein